MVMFSYVLMTLLMFSGLFLIGLVLLQRGRGGGLAGAFGGMGGQSAFGTKAGDVFTRITIGVATAWILLCAGSVVALHHASSGRTDSSVFKDGSDDAKDGVMKAEPKTDAPANGGGIGGDPNTPPAAAPQDAPKTGAEKKTEEKPSEQKPADEKPAADKPKDEKPADAAKDPAAAKPEEAKPTEPAKSGAAPADEKKPEAPKAEEPKPAEPTPEKKPE